MSKKTSSSANSFGPGSSLVGMSHRGHEIVDASRKYMHLDNGDTVLRAGNRVDHDEIKVNMTKEQHREWMQESAGDEL